MTLVKKVSKQAVKKGALSLVLLLPFCALIYGVVTNQLGPDPADVLVDETGEWTIRYLCLTLAITPFSKLVTRVSWLRKLRPLAYRRTLGVFTWLYGLVHLLSYCAFIFAWRWQEIGAELIERPYIAVGFSAFVLMTPLALTSTNAMVRRLKRHWKKLHRLIYIIAILAAVHVIWQVRSDAAEAITYSLIIASLLLYRVKLSSLRLGRN